jgi:hypothetical protein
VESSFPDRSFDIAFGQEQGDEAIIAAAWEMVELAEEVSHGRKPTLPLQLLNKFEFEYLIVSASRRAQEVWCSPVLTALLKFFF